MRGENGKAGDFQTPGTLQANATQQDYFVEVITKVVLPWFKERAKPFVLVFWSRDPDGTQHNQGDSLSRLIPGINGPTSLAAIRNADHDLAALLVALKTLGLTATTDVILTADHGFSTISKGKPYELRGRSNLQGCLAPSPPTWLRCNRCRAWSRHDDARSRCKKS
jgi:predicted AlkP superfamily pyrophosphatase or phosphodiesterase